MESILNALSGTVEPLKILRDELARIGIALVAAIPNIVATTLFLALTWLAARMISRLVGRGLRRSRMRPSLRSALVSLVRIGIWVFGWMLALTLLLPNLTPTKLLAGLGLGSIAIGLAFKDIFENFLSGILILVRKPMRIGDDIQCDGVSGRVEAIRVRDTYIRRRSGELVLVPNSFLFKNPISVLTDLPKRRISLAVGVGYEADLRQVHDVLERSLEGLPSIDSDGRVDIFVTAFGESSIDFLLRWWTGSTPIEEHRSRTEVAMAVKSAFDAAGIEIPFPQRTLTFAEPLEVGRAVGDRSSGP